MVERVVRRPVEPPPPAPRNRGGNPALYKGMPSLNPSGQPKRTPLEKEATARLKADSVENVEWLISVRRDDKAPMKVRAQIAIALLNKTQSDAARQLVAEVTHSLRPIAVVGPNGATELPVIDVKE
jgi:hypothetical protein